MDVAIYEGRYGPKQFAETFQKKLTVLFSDVRPESIHPVLEKRFQIRLLISAYNVKTSVTGALFVFSYDVTIIHPKKEDTIFEL